jgi:eukaryotic-like serine/threonine-protein kinase
LTRDFLEQKPEDPVRKRLLAANYADLGYVQLNSLETDKAVESVRKALQILGDPNGNEDHDRALERYNGHLGNALNELGSNDESIASFQRSIQIAEEVARRFPSRRARRDACLPYNNIVGPLAGRDMLNEGKAEQAQGYARHAVAVAEELAASDTTDMQALSDLAYSYTKMADSLFSTNPSEARVWYQKSIALTKKLGSSFNAPMVLAERDETLASLLVNQAQAPERLRLLREANTMRQELAKRGPNPPLGRVHLMRSYCRLSDAELAVDRLAEAGRDADLSLPFFNDFKLTSPSLVVLRDIGLCYESLGNVQHRMALDGALAPRERAAAATA